MKKKPIVLKKNQKKLLAEIVLRKTNKFSLKDFTFDKQFAFITDTAKFKSAVCSRRSGKTVACAADLINTAISCKEVVCLYITLSRNNAKKIIWPELKKINKQYDLRGAINETELSISFPNGSVVYLSGAKDASAIENFRGLALKKVYIDEAQSFRPYLKELIDDIIVPALYDYDGTLILIGTPGPICAGVFYDACHSKSWSKHHWTILDNPHIQIKSGKPPSQILQEERERRGITETDPTYLRESLGQWVNDLNALVYKYNPIKNSYTTLPSEDWYYVFGIDIGHDDADAIAVIAWSHNSPVAHVVEEWVEDKQDITSLANKIKELQVKYKPVKMVIDTGGLGKKIAVELRKRHGLPVEAADKVRKFEYIELMNDALRNERLKFGETSIAAQDYLLIQWDYKNNKKVISDAFHSDIADAVLYGWRECINYIQEPKKPKITKENQAQMQIDLWEIEEDERIKRKKNKQWWEE